MIEFLWLIETILARHFYIFVIIGGILLSVRVPRRKLFAVRLPLCLACCAGVCYLMSRIVYGSGLTAPLLCVVEIVYYMVIYAMCVAVMCICYRHTVSGALYACIFGYAFQHMSMLLISHIGYYAGARMGDLYLLLYFGVYIAAYTSIAVPILTGKLNLIDPKSVSLLVQSGVFLFCAVVLSVLSYDYIVSSELFAGTPVVFIVSAFGIVICLDIIFGIFYNMRIKRTERELSETQTLWKENVRQYDMAKENMEVLNFRLHDLKNQMFVLARDNDAVREIREYMDRYDDTADTGNEAMDVILTQKAILCRKEGITFSYMVDGSCFAGMSPVDLCSVLGNLMDNAIEYLSASSDPDKKLITLSVAREGDMDKLRIDNYISEKPELVHGLPMTTKADREAHGFGLRSIRHILKKYRGIMDISVEDGSFSVTIAVPRPR